LTDLLLRLLFRSKSGAIALPLADGLAVISEMLKNQGSASLCRFLLRKECFSTTGHT